MKTATIIMGIYAGEKVKLKEDIDPIKPWVLVERSGGFLKTIIEHSANLKLQDES